MVQSLLLIFKIHNHFLVLISSFSSGKIQVWCECDATKTIGAIACMPISITLNASQKKKKSITLNERACTRRNSQMWNSTWVLGLVLKEQLFPNMAKLVVVNAQKRKRLLIQVIFCHLHAWSLVCWIFSRDSN